MKHKLKEGLVVPRGLVTALNRDGRKLKYAQGMYIPAGHTIIEMKPIEIEAELGLKPEVKDGPPKSTSTKDRSVNS